MSRFLQFSCQQLAVLLVLLCLLLSALVLWQTAYWTREVVSEEIRDRSDNTLRLVVSNLSAELRRYQSQPELISADQRLIPLLKGTETEEQRHALNLELARINQVMGASDTYLMNADGLTVAASNWDIPNTFIGREFSFRPYFQLAMQGKAGTYFALGTTSGERGYFFGYPVTDAGDIIGVVVVKITVEALEEKWRKANNRIMVLDHSGVVFLSSEKAWQLDLIDHTTDEEMTALIASKRYVGRKLGYLPLKEMTRDYDGNITSISLASSPQTDKPTRYLVQQHNMTEAGWRVLLLADTEEITTRVNQAVGIAALIMASLLLAIANIVQRRRRLAERIAMKDATSRELERRVTERTEALSDANDKLRNEVRERQHAESELRETQAGLVQATKLAALGQMSAGVSHELNQPLAAIRSYADNGRAYIERGNHDTARENLQSISELADRMDRIIKNLRTYARDESISMRPVPIMAPIQESLSLLGERIQDDAVSVTISAQDISPVVIAGDVRLQQVFVNIISNALDSMRSSPVKALNIAVSEQVNTVVVAISDTGPGVPDALREHVFDPFYSTKSVGEGMGMGLSISYGIIDQFGGKIDIDNRPEGGAIFSVILKKADTP